MVRTVLKSKIHRAVVTGADLNYEGSITIDSKLLKLADILPFEKVDIYNITNGERFSTYVIEGEEGSGEICLNGAAARKVQKGDLIIIVSYCQLSEEELREHSPKVVLVNEKNEPTQVIAHSIFQPRP
jgi:aspartate 1-decarboxylase